MLSFAGSIIGKHTTGEDQEEDLFTYDSLITTLKGQYEAAEEEDSADDDVADDEGLAAKSGGDGWFVDKMDNEVKDIVTKAVDKVSQAHKDLGFDEEQGKKNAEHALKKIKPFIPVAGNIFVKLVKRVLNCAESPADPKTGWKETGMPYSPTHSPTHSLAHPLTHSLAPFFTSEPQPPPSASPELCGVRINIESMCALILSLCAR